MLSKIELKKQLKELGITVVAGNYIRRKDVEEVISAEKASFGSDGKFNYAVSVEGVESNFWEKPFGRQMDDLKLIKKFQETAKKESIGAKGKPTLSAVKAWVKLNKPSQYYAKWGKDSSSFKDDSVEIYYV